MFIASDDAKPTDITVGKDSATAAHFDIVIDKDNLKPTKNNSYQDLKLALQKYGSIIIKFVNGQKNLSFL